MCTPPYSLLANGWQNQFLLSLNSSLLQKISSFWGTSIAITSPSGTQEVLLNQWGGSIQLGHLFWPPPPQWPWHTHSSPSLLSRHLLCSFLLLGGASEPGFWPSINSSIRPSLSGLSSQRAPPFNFQKARWDDFASYFTFTTLRLWLLPHCPWPKEYSSLSLSSAAALFSSLALNAAKSSIPFGRIKCHPKAWWSAEVERVVIERCKAFAAAHRSDEDRQAYISASRRASSVIAKAKAEAWQTTCSSLSPRSNPKSVHSLLRSIAGSPSSSSSSPNFPNCSSPRKSASVYAAYLRSHFSVSQPKALCSRARGYLTELRRATCPLDSHSSFCSTFSPAEFLAAVSNLTSSTATGSDKTTYPMLKHLPRSGMDFLLHIFNLSWSSHSFPSIWKTSSIIPIHKMGKLSTLLLPSGLSLSPPAYQSCLNASFYPVYSSFWNLIPFSLPARPVSALVGLHLIKFCTFLSPFRMGLTNPGRALRRYSLISISRKLLTLSGIPPFPTTYFGWPPSLLCSLDSIFSFW